MHISVAEIMKTTEITKMQLIQLRVKLEKTKRRYDKKIACNIKMTARGIYESKQTVLHMVWPLDYSAGNITSEGFLFVEALNGYFGSMFN